MSTQDGSIPVGDEQEEPAGVELIAAGYEWICPECDTYNREIEATEEVTCQGCHTAYRVTDCHHATG